MISKFTNNIIAFVLIFILLANNINTLTIVSDFLINQDFIAKTLCIQKSNQQGCNGKCYLMKALKKTNPESNTTIPTQETKRQALDAFCQYNIQNIEHTNVINTTCKITFKSNTKHLNQLYFDIDTPPPNTISQSFLEGKI